MKIRGTRVQEVEVEVSTFEILTKAGDIIRTHANIPHDAFLSRDGAHLRRDDPDHRHGSISEVNIRPATDEDRATFAILTYLGKVRYEVNK